MTQKAKTQTVPVLSERMRLNPATPGCPDTKGTSAGMGPEDGCIFRDHRSGWGAAVDRAKQDEENAKTEAKLRCTARHSQNERKRQRKAREGNHIAGRCNIPPRGREMSHPDRSAPLYSLRMGEPNSIMQHGVPHIDGATHAAHRRTAGVSLEGKGAAFGQCSTRAARARGGMLASSRAWCRQMGVNESTSARERQ